MKNKYYIDNGTENSFDSLCDVCTHIESFYTEKEKKDENGSFVFRFNDPKFYRIISVNKKGKVTLKRK